MAKRSQKPSAELRTVDMFPGLTPLEAKRLPEEQEAEDNKDKPKERPPMPRPDVYVSMADGYVEVRLVRENKSETTWVMPQCVIGPISEFIGGLDAAK